jgi:murein peptide amidase A
MSETEPQPKAGAQPLGVNSGGYRGERIDIGSVLGELHAEAVNRSWSSEVFYTSDRFDLRAYRCGGVQALFRLYISAGIHGDEPAGPLACLRLVRETNWPETLEVFLCPCLNPAGFDLNTRENAHGIDLNRDYQDLKTAEIRAHAAWLGRCPDFDQSVILHEDWEARGFYLYELESEGRTSIAREIIRNVAAVCPIEPSAEIDGWPAVNGVIHPRVRPEDRSDWPEALFLSARQGGQGHTLEAPSDFALAVRVDALVAGTLAVVEHLRNHPVSNRL